MDGSYLWIEYHLHKDRSWVAEFFKTEGERQGRISELRGLGYTPRCTKARG